MPSSSEERHALRLGFRTRPRGGPSQDRSGKPGAGQGSPLRVAPSPAQKLYRILWLTMWCCSCAATLRPPPCPSLARRRWLLTGCKFQPWDGGVGQELFNGSAVLMGSPGGAGRRWRCRDGKSGGRGGSAGDQSFLVGDASDGTEEALPLTHSWGARWGF